MQETIEEPRAEETTQRQVFGRQIETLSDVDWLMRRIKMERERAEGADAWAASERELAQAEERRLLVKYGAQLKDWVISRLTGKTKSVGLPAGRAGFKKGRDKIEVTDLKALTAWCFKNGTGFVRHKVTFTLESDYPVTEAEIKRVMGSDARFSKYEYRADPEKRRISDYLSETGDLPDGVELVEGEEEFYLDFGKGKLDVSEGRALPEIE